ncbi:DUF6912 family protein [Labedaea rhizosphaerae]|jgi:hypothetical protein|uniref:Uncharacterized protein n=1 Tax=Labedaea rhizosphaerae TaxID=598644 RepID=A0A4V6PVQ2_LABRH|nr:hypothetical protein [Labedaea rhizosphaerae]TDP93738.1 hypothetical protein EV186_106132 [Labedaea rhizosphaerae]
MRVYIPATIAMLRKLSESGELTALGGTAFAVTPAFRESYATGGDEELEYAAMLDASRASLRLLAAELAEDPKAMPRRVVVSADVEDVQLRPDLDFAVVRLSGPVPMREVAAVHVDTEEAEDAVRAASEVIDKADLGDPDAEFTLGDAEDFELAWYATQELPFLLDLM